MDQTLVPIVYSIAMYVVVPAALFLAALYFVVRNAVCNGIDRYEKKKLDQDSEA